MARKTILTKLQTAKTARIAAALTAAGFNAPAGDGWITNTGHARVRVGEYSIALNSRGTVLEVKRRNPRYNVIFDVLEPTHPDHQLIASA